MNKFIKLNCDDDETGEDQLPMPMPMMPMLEKPKDYKSFNSKFHSLYIEKDKLNSETINIPFEKIKGILSEEQLSKFQGEEVFKGSLELGTPEIEYLRFTLNIGDFMHFDGDVGALNTIIYELDRAKETDILNISIASDGGLIDEYIRLRTHIKSSFAGRISTVCDPKAYSAGAMLFLCGDQRVVYEDCSLMFHTYKGGVWGTGVNQLDQIVHNEERFNNMFRREMVTPGYMTEEEYKEYRLGKEFWLTFDKIIERGVATHIVVDDCLLTREEYIQLKECLTDLPDESDEVVEVVEVPEVVEVKTEEASEKTLIEG